MSSEKIEKELSLSKERINKLILQLAIAERELNEVKMKARYKLVLMLLLMICFSVFKKI